MRTLRMYPTSINERYIDGIVDDLRRGELIVYPTDTRYAIGCDALNARAVERICRLRGIDPRRHPLSIVCADISQASDYARIDNRSFALIRSLAPGPYTFILPGTTSLPRVFKGRKEIGLRIPDSPIARAIARALGNPIMTSSIPSLDIDTAGIALSIDAGDMPEADSTIIDCTDPADPAVTRPGLGPTDLPVRQ